ncbi:hypothetical protein LIER_24677 [Lithospermum erythrorhizon]|uniref:Uncharacterized protein n=1 Tax=Lithospermum erythrorhizon TaxID=34254 RepID=A0AAV3R3J6_LITER
MGRPPCCDKANVKRGSWSPDEDAKILAYVANHGIGNWTLVPQKAGLNRCGKSCRLRWTNYLRPDLRHDNFTLEEEEQILQLHQTVGSRWSLIAARLPGRTDNDVKNYWNTKLKKKLEKMGIDPITHKPLAQVLTEYEKISQLKSRNQNLSLNNEAMMRAEPQHIIPLRLSNTKVMERQIVEPLCKNFLTTSHSWSKMAQSQANEAIYQETVQSHFFSEASSSASSASCNSLTPFSSPRSYPSEPSLVRFSMSSSFPWNEYILDDTPSTMNTDKFSAPEFQGNVSANNLIPEASFSLLNNVRNGSEPRLGEVTQAKGGISKVDHPPEASSSNGHPFVETILARHEEMQTEFPDLLDGYYEY